ncbi:MAG TPA: NADP-dependent oxidoreductase [Streptosporangiaceae bacterium]|jgi:NADPH:quinone reductase-like Zn-dependent oxidoreductase|nr:NADP-dependent oxidoreductase [Streptosporangiaceae bacterium]
MACVVVAAAYGGPEVLEVIEVPAGAPGPGQALVEVRAAGVNPIDYKQYSGAFGADPARLPMRLGFEVSGVVTEVGPDATGTAGGVSVGDEVIGYRVDGGYASELIAPVASLTPKPAALDWAQAAGLMLTGATAWHCLAATGVTGGDTVLIHGGSGGVGTVAVQLAVGRGATVIATASPARHEFLRELGAIPVTYGAGLADRVRAAAPGGVDVAIDMIGTEEAIDVSRELVADHDRIVTIVASARSRETGTRALGGGPGADPGTEIRQAARLELARLAGEGSLRVFVSETFPLAEAAKAHRAISTNHAFGKIVLIP